jgi:O-antigen/teichoic acid export membrane protein
LTPFYTHILSESEYGVTDLLIQTGNFLLPIVSAGILNVVIRFGLEKDTNKTSVFTTGLTVILIGGILLSLCFPLLQNFGIQAEYTILLLLYVSMANLHSLCGAFAQALGKIRLYAISGILCTGLAVSCNILFLAVFHLGVTGYILSNVIADGVSALVLFVSARLWRYISPAEVQKELVKRMFQYCLPLIPVTVCSWIINISDRYFE